MTTSTSLLEQFLSAAAADVRPVPAPELGAGAVVHVRPLPAWATFRLAELAAAAKDAEGVALVAAKCRVLVEAFAYAAVRDDGTPIFGDSLLTDEARTRIEKLPVTLIKRVADAAGDAATADPGGGKKAFAAGGRLRFLFRLAATLGRPAGWILRNVSGFELELWAAFHAAEPFGDRQADERAAAAAILPTAAFSGERIDPAALFVSLRGDEPAKQDGKGIGRGFRAWAAANCPAMVATPPDRTRAA